MPWREKSSSVSDRHAERSRVIRPIG
jgi:hypothetical protein